MYHVEIYVRVRRACMVEGMSVREASRVFGLHRDTVRKMLWKVLWMYHVEIYVRVRRACMVEGMSVREASRVFGLHRDTVRKMLAYSAPPG